MICMLRAGKLHTKQVCAKALMNLVTEDTLKQLVDDDIVNAVSKMSVRPVEPIEDDEILLAVCAELFLYLSTNDYSRARLIQRQTFLDSIFNLVRSQDLSTKVVCGKVACNLLSFEDS